MLLTELFHELLYLPVLLNAVVLGVVHQAPGTAFVTVRWLMWALVAARATTPTSRCCCCSGSSSQRLVFAASLLLLLLSTALRSGIRVGLASLSYLWGRL
jgi:hypothetical protein